MSKTFLSAPTGEWFSSCWKELQDYLQRTAPKFDLRPGLKPQAFENSHDFHDDTFEITRKGPVKTPPRFRSTISIFDKTENIRFTAKKGGPQFSNDFWGIETDIRLRNLLEAQGVKTVEMEVPQHLFSKEVLAELIALIQDFNRFDDNPILDIEWLLADNNRAWFSQKKSEDGFIRLMHFNKKNYSKIFLNHSLFDSEHTLETAKSILVHELAHGLDFSHGLSTHPDWRSLHLVSLHFFNFHLLMDWHYYPDQVNGGHPADNPAEFFASAVHAYYFRGDLLLKRIQNASSPEMRDFGIAVWCYLRDRIFHGQVFIPGQDPFKDFKLEDYLQSIAAQRERLLIASFALKDPFVGWAKDHLLAELDQLMANGRLEKVLSDPKSSLLEKRDSIQAIHFAIKNYGFWDKIRHPLRKSLLTLQLQRFTEHPQPYIRQLAAHCLSHLSLQEEFPRPMAIDILKKLAETDPDELVRLQSLLHLFFYHAEQEGVTRFVQPFLQQEENLLDAFLEIEKITYLEEHIRHTELGKINQDFDTDFIELEEYAEAIALQSETLRRLLRHPHFIIRKKVVEALRWHPSFAELEANAVALMEALQDPHPAIRLDAALALMASSWGAETESVKIALRELQEDEDEEVRKLISDWLGQNTSESFSIGE